MPLEVKLEPKLIYRLRLTPQMRLALDLLPMPIIELKEYLKEEIEKNPLLEGQDYDPIGSRQMSDTAQDTAQYGSDIRSAEPTLQDHLLRQLRSSTAEKNGLEIGEFIIGNIDDDGYFTDEVDETAKYLKVPESKIEEALKLIQTFDPIGAGSRDLRECLMLQLKSGGRGDSYAYKIVDSYMGHLEKKRFYYIAKRLGIGIEKVREAVNEITRLEPKPGRSFNAERPVQVIPDLLLMKDKGRYRITLNDQGLPRIRLNEKYIQMMKKGSTPGDVKQYLRERMGRAKALISALEKRENTIREAAEAIVDIQKDFLDKGEIDFKPMTLSRIASRIGKHKSTVSRVLANKYIETPRGVFALRSFLNSGVRQENGLMQSSKTIKSKILNLIKEENKKACLSDREIKELLKAKYQISIARRTIAKYRKCLKIPSSSSRRR